MTLRIGIGGLWHETNVYATPRIGPTTLAQFHVRRGAEIVDRYRGTRTTLGGVIEEASSASGEVELVPLVHAAASPWGTIDHETYRELSADLVASVEAAGPLDGIFLDLHGAGVAAGVDDVEADLTHRIKEVTPRTRLTTALDLHANVGQRTIAALDAAFLYQTYPHVDSFERGAEATRTLLRACRGEIRPATYVLPIPMHLPPLAGWTGGEPIQAMNRACQEAEQMPGILDCALAHGFAYAPGPRVLTSVVVVADNDPAAAEVALRRAARYVWEHRGDLEYQAPLAAEGIARARAVLAARGGPVVINEANDNPGSGAPGDGTHLLRALLEAGDLRATIGPLTDPAAATAAHQAGLGSTIRVPLGGSVDRSGLSGPPIDAQAQVIGLSDGRFTRRKMAAGLAIDLGHMAALRVGSVDVVVTTEATQAFEPVYFETAGVDPRTYDVVAVKSINHFRAGFADLWTAAIAVDGPGLSCVDIRQLATEELHCWPWDPAVVFLEGSA